MQIAFLRLGWVAEEGSDISVVSFGAGVGLTTQWFVFRFDYALVPLELLGISANIGKRDHKFGLVLGVPLHTGAKMLGAY